LFPQGKEVACARAHPQHTHASTQSFTNSKSERNRLLVDLFFNSLYVVVRAAFERPTESLQMAFSPIQINAKLMVVPLFPQLSSSLTSMLHSWQESTSNE
jgi:hypothetical protein